MGRRVVEMCSHRDKKLTDWIISHMTQAIMDKAHAVVCDCLKLFSLGSSYGLFGSALFAHRDYL